MRTQPLKDPSLDELLDNSLFYDSNIYYDDEVEQEQSSGSFHCVNTSEEDQELLLLN